MTISSIPSSGVSQDRVVSQEINQNGKDKTKFFTQELIDRYGDFSNANLEPPLYDKISQEIQARLAQFPQKRQQTVNSKFHSCMINFYYPSEIPDVVSINEGLQLSQRLWKILDEEAINLRACELACEKNNAYIQKINHLYLAAQSPKKEINSKRYFTDSCKIVTFKSGKVYVYDKETKTLLGSVGGYTAKVMFAMVSTGDIHEDSRVTTTTTSTATKTTKKYVLKSITKKVETTLVFSSNMLEKTVTSTCPTVESITKVKTAIKDPVAVIA